MHNFINILLILILMNRNMLSENGHFNIISEQISQYLNNLCHKTNNFI